MIVVLSFLGKLFEAVPRRWIDPSPNLEFYVCCAPSVQRSIHRGNQLKFKL